MGDAAQRWTSRKFWFSVLTVCLASWLLRVGSIDADAWLKLCSAVCLGYLGANVVQKATAKTPTIT
ncbi:MAG: hypothetical protein ABIP42_17695 [Planctomycetota bacterium]